MNKNLQSAIHKYAEDREIDYIAAKVIGEQNGLVFKSEKDLVEWKQTIDRYLKTFNQNDWSVVERMCEGKDDRCVQDGTGPYKDSNEYKSGNKGSMSGKKTGLGLYTKSELAKLRKKYNVDTNEEALKRAIKDKQK